MKKKFVYDISAAFSHVADCLRRMALCHACVLVLATSFSTAARAADQNGQFAIRGAGLQTCQNAVAAFDTASSDLALYSGWIDGYLTGLNQFREDTFEMASWQTASTLLAMTVQVCRSQPDDTGFMRTFVNLMRGFSGSALSEESALTGVFSGTQRVALYEATVEAIERTLSELGYEVGVIDAEFSQETALALGEFQQAHGLEETGVPDQKTLFALFVGTAITGAQDN